VAAFAVKLNGDAKLPPSGIRIRNVKVGRAIHSLSDITNCYDVDISGLSLAPEGAVTFTPTEFVAGGGSAKEFSANGSWRTLIRQVKPGDRVVLRFPPSRQRDSFARQVYDMGGVVKID
jgi:hypothetical protein